MVAYNRAILFLFTTHWTTNYSLLKNVSAFRTTVGDDKMIRRRNSLSTNNEHNYRENRKSKQFEENSKSKLFRLPTEKSREYRTTSSSSLRDKLTRNNDPLPNETSGMQRNSNEESGIVNGLFCKDVKIVH